MNTAIGGGDMYMVKPGRNSKDVLLFSWNSFQVQPKIRGNEKCVVCFTGPRFFNSNWSHKTGSNWSQTSLQQNQKPDVRSQNPKNRAKPRFSNALKYKDKADKAVPSKVLQHCKTSSKNVIPLGQTQQLTTINKKPNRQRLSRP